MSSHIHDDGDFERFMHMTSKHEYLILDTETTGLDRGSEVIDICVIDADGIPRLNTLVKPTKPIPPDATRIHHITNEMVEGKPKWGEISADLAQLIGGRDLVVYNSKFDRKIMHYSDELALKAHFEWKEIANWWCAMTMFAQWYGDWNDYYQSYRWQRLTNAVSIVGGEYMDAHSAHGDCLMTLQVIEMVRRLNVKSYKDIKMPF